MQEELKINKGPWKKGDGSFGDKLMVYCDDGLGIAVADCDLPYSFKLTNRNNLANAHLIAAAPELYEALESIYTLLKNEADQGRYPQFLLQENGGNGLGFMQAALKKAKGE